MLGNDEFVFVKSYYCETYRNDIEKGEGDAMYNAWSHVSVPVDDDFDSVDDALKGVLDANLYDWKGREPWTDMFDKSGKASSWERGRYCYTTMVDATNSEATPEQIKRWKNGEIDLFNCHVDVRLGVRSRRELADDEM